MEDVVDSPHGLVHAACIAHVADPETHLGGQLRMARLQPVAHVVLLLFVAREDADLAYPGIKEMLEDGGAERSRAASDKQCFSVKGRVHEAFLSIMSNKVDSNVSRNDRKVKCRS